MPDDDALVIRLASAIVDATGPDWAAAESTAVNADVGRLIRELRVVAALAAVHRESPPAPANTPIEAPSDTLSRWGPLLLRGTVGQGHFGTVYLAWDEALERQVALKLLRGTSRAGEIIQEGRLLARVRHPNVVTVYGVDRHDGVVGLWMEFVDGLTLARVLATRGALDPREAALVGIDLCRAVAAVHKAGLVHRDIKAHNVMREGSGRIVLMDFGAGELRTERSGPGTAAGTPLYLAPELFAGGPATIASDVYSMGVLLFHLVTMRYPVEGATLEQIAAAQVRRERHHLGELRPDLPDSFSTIVERALDRDPARRYRTCDEMQRDLMDAAQQYGSPQVSADAPDRSGRTASVAVLPFANLGPDRDVEYLSSGLADELLTGLGKVPGLRLVSRTSAAHAAGAETDIRRLCRRLGVDAVIEGTVRKSGDRVRITAQLVSAVDGCHLWSDGYDRDAGDVFAVVDDIARSVVDRLKVSLAEVLRRPLVDRHTENARAYEYYLKGRFYWTRRYHGGLVAALEHFKKAIEEDAGYALAFAGLADAYAFIGVYAVQRPRLALAQAVAAAKRALDAQPGPAGSAHVVGLHQDGQRLGSGRRRAGVRSRPGAGSAAGRHAHLLLVAAGAPGRRRQCDGSDPRRAGNRAALTARERRSRAHAVPGAALRRGHRRMREEPRDRPELHPRHACHRHVPGAAGPPARSGRPWGTGRVDVGPRAVLSRRAGPLSCAPRCARRRAGDSARARRGRGDPLRPAALLDVHLCGA